MPSRAGGRPLPDRSESASENRAAAEAVPAGQLAVSEMFESFQGEGPRTGFASFFVRLRHCDGTCTWCDAKYTWLRGGEGKNLRTAEVLTAIRQSRAPNVVITGGEPLLQYAALTDLVRAVLTLKKSVEIETNGANAPLGIFGVHYNVSPKLSSARSGLAYDPKTIEAFLREDAHWKFVIASEEDLREAAAFAERFDLPRERVVFMPEGTTREVLHERLAWMAPWVRREMPEARVLTRLHVEVYGKALKGV